MFGLSGKTIGTMALVTVATMFLWNQAARQSQTVRDIIRGG